MEFVGDGGVITIAKDVMEGARGEQNADQKSDWENGENASIRVFWEEPVPFFENVADAVGG